MNNVILMKKVKELMFQTLHSREQSLRVMVQSATICKAFGVKNDEYETEKSVAADYERNVVMSDNEIRNDFNKYMGFLKWVIEQNDLDKQREYKNRLHDFVEAVGFFNKELYEEFYQTIYN
ncbi:hypothetical protein F4V43_02415 [Paenibacillus spiritus]|uniref:Uncharacterized protein n=1 Tax=Paenibacillus spiritus TaxID=2496557 RepID=A0A5J5GH77_9BACL|nr:hypothetical protein [Paenibacillus spiritus]KAA9007360.1 hypothetical protein F4V43_02415 [Paenibacillus spiritus]